MSTTLTRAPSVFQIQQALEIAANFLATIEPPPDDAEAEREGSNHPPSDAEILLEELRERGADIGRIVERLLLAGDEARSEADAIKERQRQLKLRKDAREAYEGACRNAVLHIMRSLPELFPAPRRSTALAGYHSALVDARVQPGKPGVKLAEGVEAGDLEVRFQRIKIEPNLTALKEAVLEDGEVVDGVEETTGEPFLTVKVA